MVFLAGLTRSIDSLFHETKSALLQLDLVSSVVWTQKRDLLSYKLRSRVLY